MRTLAVALTSFTPPLKSIALYPVPVQVGIFRHSAFQIEIPVGTGVIQNPFNPGTAFEYQVGWGENVAGPVTSDPCSITGGASWIIVDGNSCNQPPSSICLDSLCSVGEGIGFRIDATGLSAGAYEASLIFSGQYFSGSFNIALNVLPSGVTN